MKHRYEYRAAAVRAVAATAVARAVPVASLEPATVWAATDGRGPWVAGGFGTLEVWMVVPWLCHGVSPRDRWLCVLPRGQINVNVNGVFLPVH